MTPETIFQLSSTLALVGWIVLIVISPLWLNVDKFLIGVIITLLAMVYAWIIFLNFSPGDIKKFNSLDGVMSLFQNKTLLTAGWVHYLAFDLMTGIWINRNAIMHNINHWLVVPALLFTFMLGPAGFLLYLLIRWIKTKQYFADNFA
ncbi:MAG: ABA4-like family protein [Ginsengibacter sp.]